MLEEAGDSNHVLIVSSPSFFFLGLVWIFSSHASPWDRPMLSQLPTLGTLITPVWHVQAVPGIDLTLFHDCLRPRACRLLTAVPELSTYKLRTGGKQLAKLAEWTHALLTLKEPANPWLVLACFLPLPPLLFLLYMKGKQSRVVLAPLISSVCCMLLLLRLRLSSKIMLS